MFLFKNKLNYSKYWLYLPILMIVSLLSIFDSNFSHAQTTTGKDFVGAWKVYKDDDTPDEDMPSEIMNFWNDGKFSISGKYPHIGLFRINGNRLQLMVKIGDKAMPVERTFQLTGHKLKFKNEKIGWVYYKRVSDTPLGNPPNL